MELIDSLARVISDITITAEQTCFIRSLLSLSFVQIKQSITMNLALTFRLALFIES
jgi:hypothetical protein